MTHLRRLPHLPAAPQSLSKCSFEQIRCAISSLGGEYATARVHDAVCLGAYVSPWHFPDVILAFSMSVRRGKADAVRTSRSGSEDPKRKSRLLTNGRPRARKRW